VGENELKKPLSDTSDVLSVFAAPGSREPSR